MKTEAKATKKSSIKTSALLALEGGLPVRTEPLPWDYPGASFIDEEELELVTSVVRAHSPFRFYGPQAQHMVDMLEHEWRETFGHRYALGVSSGTAGLTVSIAALGLGPGDEVMVPGYLCMSGLAAIVRAGAIPRLVDIDDTFCMSPDDLKAKITPRTKAVIYNHMCGAPGHIQKIAELCKKWHLSLIEDCSQAAGASFEGTPVGRFGDIGVFSFQLNKNMTSGEGGMVVCQDHALFRRLLALHDLGYPRTLNGALDASREHEQLWGMGARMAELSGALALAQLRKLPQITSAMRKAKWAIRKGLAKTPGLTFREVPDPAGDSGAFLLLLLENAPRAKYFTDALRAEGVCGPPGSVPCVSLSERSLHWYCNIPSLVHKRSNSREGFPWTHPDNAFACDYSYYKGTLPVCDDYHERTVVLTIAPTLKEQDIKDVTDACQKVARVVQSNCLRQ